MKHRTFLTHFLLCLALASGVFFAGQLGVLKTIWLNDQSHMTSAIGALLVVAAIELGRQAWNAGALWTWRNHLDDIKCRDNPAKPSGAFGHLAERLSVMLGFIGTAIGLSLQAQALAGGATSFTALATSLYTTAVGGTAAAIIAVMTFNLERSAK